MSNVIEREVIVREKLGQLEEKLVEGRYWTKILKTESIKDDKFLAKHRKLRDDWTEFSTIYQSKVEASLLRQRMYYTKKDIDSNQICSILKEFYSSFHILLDDFDKFIDEESSRFALLSYLKRTHVRTLNNIHSSFELLEDPNVTLEQIQAVAVPNFDWAINNYHPSHFDLEMFTEKARIMSERFAKTRSALDILLGKIEEALVLEVEAKVNEAEKTNVQNE